MRRPVGLVAAVVAIGSVLAGCGASGGAETGEPGGGPSGQVTVLAASSLTEAFGELGRRFEKVHPGTSVQFSFGGSSGLAQQLRQGARADVFAAANTETMKTVTETGDAKVAGFFARSRLMIAVPRGNPGHVTGLRDLARPALHVALCAPQVPCGDAAASVLDAAGVTARPDTLEQDVKAVVAKLRLGEVDAALVYRTDVRAASGEVDGIDFPESARAVNDYPIATVTHGDNPSGARAFVAYVLSDEGRRVLSRAGFEPPRPDAS